MRGNKRAFALLLGALAAAGSGQSLAADMAADMAAAKAKAGQCFVCHGADGLAKVPDAPNLAGQNEGYLVKALKEYKSGKRENEMMNTMARNLSDQDIALVAAYFSGIAITVKAP